MKYKQEIDRLNKLNADLFESNVSKDADIQALTAKTHRLEAELKQAKESWAYFEKQLHKSDASENYYRKQLAKAHELLGRVVHQTSERWDRVNLTEFYPTDNLLGKRGVNDPTGENHQSSSS